MNAKVCHLDANVLLRFVRNDDRVQSPQARKLLLLAQAGGIELKLSVLCVAEVFYALRASYKFSRPDAARLLGDLLHSLPATIESPQLLLAALERVGRNNVDLGDAMLAETAVDEGHMVASFDQDFNRFDDVTCYPWTSS